MSLIKCAQLLDIFDRFWSELDLEHARNLLLCTERAFALHYTMCHALNLAKPDDLVVICADEITAVWKEVTAHPGLPKYGENRPKPTLLPRYGVKTESEKPQDS